MAYTHMREPGPGEDPKPWIISNFWWALQGDPRAGDYASIRDRFRPPTALGMRYELDFNAEYEALVDKATTNGHADLREFLEDSLTHYMRQEHTQKVDR